MGFTLRSVNFAMRWGDSASNPRFVATIPGRGYRFIAPVAQVSDGRPLSRPRAKIYAALMVLAFCTAGSFVWRWWHDGSMAPRSTAPLLNVVPLTSYPGTQRSPSLSPDGERVAFAWTGQAGDNLDIYIQNVDGGAPVRLTTDPAADDYPAWSPDGSRIAFIRRGAVFTVPSEGETKQRLPTWQARAWPGVRTVRCWPFALRTPRPDRPGSPFSRSKPAASDG